MSVETDTNMKGFLKPAGLPRQVEFPGLSELMGNGIAQSV